MSLRELLEAILGQLEMMNEEKSELEKRIARLETPEPLLSRAEAARFCGVTPATITNWERRALIHRERLGAKTGFLRSELRRRIGIDTETYKA